VPHVLKPDSFRNWRRNQFAITAASFIGFAGFTLVMPFLPLYFRQLGVTDVGEAAIWSGLSLGLTPAITALLSPLWGRVADRFGRKLMVERSLISFVVLMSAMAYATRAWHIFVLRAVQGLFAGYGGLTLAMAAESAPKDRLASSIGMVQTAQRLGPALGPVIGAVLADAVGLRRSFFVTAGFYGIALILVVVMYGEPRAERAIRATGSENEPTVRKVLAFPNFVLLITAIVGIQFVDRSLGPILPLYLSELGFADSRVALVAGVLFSILACAAALGHHSCGRLLRRYPPRFVIIGGGSVGGISIGLFALATPTWLLALTMGLFGIGVGAAMTASYTAAGMVVPEGAHGTAFGLLTGALLTGQAISQVACGLLGGVSIRLVFVLDVLVLLVLVTSVRRVMVDQPLAAESGVAEQL
jgi:DHA1 family multidrug resistance protein-like MFS transporter